MKAFRLLSLVIIEVAFISTIIGQSTIIPPRDIRSKSLILKDVSIGDSVRVVYGKTQSCLNKVGGSVEYFWSDVIAVEKEGKIYYGYAIYADNRHPVVVKSGGRALLKTDEDEQHSAFIIYGCNAENRIATNVSPNFVTGGTISTTSSKSIVCAHIIMEENEFTKIANSSLKKIRLETDNGYIDFSFSSGNPNKNINKILPELQKAIQKVSTGFDEGF